MTITIFDNLKVYRFTNYQTQKFRENEFTFFTSLNDYNKYYLNSAFNILKKLFPKLCCSYSESSYMYQVTFNKLKLFEIENETIINLLIFFKYDLKLFCNLLDIDGFYTKDGFYGGYTYYIYIQNHDYNIELLNDNIPDKPEIIKIYEIIKISILFLINIIIFKLYKNPRIINNSIQKFNYQKDNYNKEYYYNHITQNINRKNNSFITWNIHSGKNVYNKNTINNIIETIKILDSDIICLQELPFNNTIEKSLENKYNVKRFRSLLFATKYQIIEYKYGYLKYTEFYHRVYQLITLVINGKKIKICHTHLDAFDHSGTKRIQQLSELLNTIDNQTILVGDFNDINPADYTDDRLDFFNKFENKYKPIENLHKYLYAYDDIFLKEKSNQYSCWTLKRVDYILLPKGYNQITKNTTDIIHTNLSDHSILRLQYNY